MTFRWIHLFFFLFLLGFSKGIRKNYGGSYARDGQFPFMALLNFGSDVDDPSMIQLCGGSIIHERWILTVAHCITDDDKPPLLTVGTVDITGLGTDYEVEKLYVHPDYVYIPKEENEGIDYIVNDIGLIRVASNIAFNDLVQPIVLAMDRKKTYADSMAMSMGWGRDPTHQTNSKRLRFIRIRVLPPKKCRRAWPNYTDRHVCASNEEGQGGCNGDSGSPLVVNRVLIGLVSGGDDECRGREPDRFTKVASFVPWIKKILARHGDVLPDS